MTSPDPVPDDGLIPPQVAARLLGVHAATLAQWAREGRLSASPTSGGHRRYLLSEIRYLHDVQAAARKEAEQLAEDACRLYDQGLNMRQVAEKLGASYQVMRRILRPPITATRRARTGPGQQGIEG